jgi:hypothetical protein
MTAISEDLTLREWDYMCRKLALLEARIEALEERLKGRPIKEQPKDYSENYSPPP